MEWKEHAARYEEELKKQNQEEREETKRPRDSVNDAHSAKGLEYPVVFVVDANEGIVPHHKAGLPADIEEERRLFYVALTRAKDRLHVAAVKRAVSQEDGCFPVCGGSRTVIKSNVRGTW